MDRFAQKLLSRSPLGQAALPIKDAARLVRGNLRRGTRLAGERFRGSSPPLPFRIVEAADEVLSAAEGFVRGIVTGDLTQKLVKAFPLPAGAYFDDATATPLSPRRLFVKTHYAVAKRMIADDPGLFVSESAIDAAYRDLRASRSRCPDQDTALAAAMTLALLRHRPIVSSAPMPVEPGVMDGRNLAVFAAIGLATAAAGLGADAQAGASEFLSLASDVVEARANSFAAALAAPDAEGELHRLFAALAPILL